MAGKTATRSVALLLALVIAFAGVAAPQPAQAQEASPSLAAAGVPELAVSAQPLTAQALPLSTQAQSDMTVFGADVSQWQGAINWKKAAKTLKFAIIRCGYGDNLSYQDDTRWLENARKCRANGVPMGVYLYSYATNTTMAKSEANHVIRCLNEAGLNAKSLELPIYLDMEDASTAGLSPDAYASIFKAFKKKLNASGYSNVGVYANADWWSWRLSTIQLKQELRWVAQWSALFAGYPSLSEKGCGIWQYTDDARVSGISGAVDGNYARYDLPYLNQAPAATPTPAKNNNTAATPSVYVLYNAQMGDRIYTTDSDERANLKKVGWKSKGTLGKVPNKTSMAVFRFYKAATGAHYFTTSKAKYGKLIRNSKWAYEGVAFYSQLPSKGVPVYRYVNGGKYCYSKKASLDGWKQNGVGWYAVK